MFQAVSEMHLPDPCHPTVSNTWSKEIQRMRPRIQMYQAAMKDCCSRYAIATFINTDKCKHTNTQNLKANKPTLRSSDTNTHQLLTKLNRTLL